MLTPEPYVANLTSFWYTQRASTLVLLCQACKIIQLRCRLHEVVLTLLLCVCVGGGGGQGGNKGPDQWSNSGYV
jgi:hypothetical protein